MTREELIEAAKKGLEAAKELFEELGRKRAGDWGVINQGMLALERASREAP